MKNPDKYIRKAVVDAITSKGRSIYYELVPKSVSVGNTWLIISAQSSQMYEQSIGCFEWLCQFNIMCHERVEQGFPPTTALDDLTELVMSALDTNAGFEIGQGYDTRFVDITNRYTSTIPADNSTIYRKIISYETWITKQ